MKNKKTLPVLQPKGLSHSTKITLSRRSSAQPSHKENDRNQCNRHYSQAGSTELIGDAGSRQRRRGGDDRLCGNSNLSECSANCGSGRIRRWGRSCCRFSNHRSACRCKGICWLCRLGLGLCNGSLS